ncbi:MAG: hypothetical protein EA380_06280 [Phycisphaeraceae bacterium]|nr:MAG: hypothetical protein EA380_06280 [Phycisphaeraceae bacterium]
MINSTNQPTRLRKQRLAPPGASGSGTATWVSRLCILLPAMALVWVILVLIAPLPDATTSDSRTEWSIQAIERLRIPERPAIDDRQAQLATLRQDNPFAANRAFWRLEEIRAAAGVSDETESASRIQPTIASTNARADIVITPPERLPDDVRSALDNIRFSGLRSRRDGEIVAMLMLKNGPLANRMLEYAEGVQFEDANHPRAKWEVLRIDTDDNRLLLGRSNSVVALDLFPASPVLAMSRPGRSDPDISVDRQSYRDAMRDLRISGEVSDAELDLLAELLGESPLAAEESDIPEADPEQRDNPASGLQEVFRLMQETERKREQQGAPKN